MNQPPPNSAFISSISSQVRAPLPASAEGNEFAMFLLVRKFNLCTPHEIRCVPTPKYIKFLYISNSISIKYFSFGGYLFRVLVQPRGRDGYQYGLGAYYECGGPDVRIFPAAGVSSQHLSPFWSVNVRSNTVLLHPSKWKHIGITEDDVSIFDKDDYPKQPLDLNNTLNYTFMAGQASGYGIPGFARFGMLQPGLFADDDMNVVIVVRLVLNDGFNSNAPVENSESENGLEEDGESESGKKKEEEPKSPFMEAFSRRSILMEKMVDWDKKLNAAKNQTVRNVLQKEIDNLTDTMNKLPALESYV